MTTARPTEAEIREAAKERGIDIDGTDLAVYHASVHDNLGVYAEIDAQDDDPGLACRGGDWKWADPTDNPLGAWHVKTDIQTSTDGPPAGKTVALKDNIGLAGVPAMNGTNLLRGHVATADATVVTRLLDAGARIVGKATVSRSPSPRVRTPATTRSCATHTARPTRPRVRPQGAALWWSRDLGSCCRGTGIARLAPGRG